MKSHWLFLFLIWTYGALLVIHYFQTAFLGKWEETQLCAACLGWFLMFKFNTSAAPATIAIVLSFCVAVLIVNETIETWDK